MARSGYCTETQMIERQIDRVPGSARVSRAGFGAAPKQSFFLTAHRSELANPEEKFAIPRGARQHARRVRATQSTRTRLSQQPIQRIVHFRERRAFDRIIVMSAAQFDDA